MQITSQPIDITSSFISACFKPDRLVCLVALKMPPSLALALALSAFLTCSDTRLAMDLSWADTAADHLFTFAQLDLWHALAGPNEMLPESRNTVAYHLLRASYALALPCHSFVLAPEPKLMCVDLMKGAALHMKTLKYTLIRGLVGWH